jgi:hypothetical protein
MTIHEAIEQADKEKPNTIDTTTKNNGFLLWKV